MADICLFSKESREIERLCLPFHFYAIQNSPWNIVVNKCVESAYLHKDYLMEISQKLGGKRETTPYKKLVSER